MMAKRMSMRDKRLSTKSEGIPARKKEEPDRGIRCRQKKSALPMLCDTDESSSDTEESDDDVDPFEEEKNDLHDLPAEFWQIQKLVRYLKIGKPTAVVLALCALRDCTFEERVCQKAFKENDGLAMTLNLLETDVLRCQVAALKLLRKIARIPTMRHAIVDLGGLESIVDNLADPSLQLRRLVAETISIVATFDKASRIVRKRGAIPYLVDILDIPDKILHLPDSKMSWQQLLKVHGAQYGAQALWSLSSNRKNKRVIWKSGALPLLGNLLKSIHVDLLIPVIGTIQECASQPDYRLAIRELDMLDDIQQHMSNENVQLKQYCASAIFKCAEDPASRDYFGVQGGLVPLVGIVNRAEYHTNKDLMKATTGAIWKCSLSPENVKRLQELGVLQTLVQLLMTQPEEVLVNVVGAIGMSAQLPANQQIIRKAGGIEPLVRLLSRTSYDLVENVTTAVGACAKDLETMLIIERMDGVRLVWSHLKSKCPAVQASAAWALCPCIENVKDSADMVRSFVGGLELIVNLLESKENNVLEAVCAVIACIARDEENLAVLTDYNIVQLLSALAHTKHSKLQHKLSQAIAACCPWSTNRLDFGDCGVVVPLVNYLKSEDNDVRCATVHALYQLSLESRNCVTMHTHGVVKLMLKMVEDKDESVQRSAAGCLQNIRLLAITKEKLQCKTPNYLK